jgi:Flp pilus assembly protein TadD
MVVLVLVVIVGVQMWGTRKGSGPPPPAGSAKGTLPSASRAPATSTRAGGAVQSSSSSGPSEALLAETGEPPTSLYAPELEAIRLLIEQGKEAVAEAKLVALPPEALGDPQIRKYTATLWNNLGVMQAKARGIPAGVPAYKTAVALDPAQPRAHLNLVIAYWSARDPALTRELLEKTIGMAPDDPFPHLALADLLYEKDDLAGAAAHLDIATQRAGQDPTLKSFLEFVTAKVKREQRVEQKFLSRESTHFTVKFDGEEDHAVWNRVAEILEDAYRDIGQKFGYFPEKPIMVVLHTRDTFQSATGSPAWADGLFDPLGGRIKVPTQGALTDQAWLTRVLRHEFVHALLHQRMGGRLGAVPTWLNEGLAMQLAGDPWPDIDQLVQGRVTLIPLNNLEGGWGGLPSNVATVAYLEGNSATLYLIDRFGMEKVREIIGLLANGQPIGAAVQDRLFIPYDQFQRRWVDTLNEKLHPPGR